MFKIIVDADSCPKKAKEIILKNAKRLGLAVIYAANRPIPFALEDPKFQMVVTDSTSGAADDWIVNNVAQEDLVITRDIPLAERLIAKGIQTINDRGREFKQENIREMLAQRELNMALSGLGLGNNGRRDSYGPKEVYEFSNCLDRILSKKSRNV